MPPASGLSISISYFGETVAHPGAVVGLELGLFENAWYRLGLGLDLGLYLHVRNHLGAFLGARVSNRFAASSGLFGELDAGLGYLHTWAHGDIYAMQPDGSVGQVPNSGFPHLMIRSDMRAGFDFWPTRPHSARFLFRTDAVWRASLQ